MPVILDSAQAPTLSALLGAIPQANALVKGIQAGAVAGGDPVIQGIGALRSASNQEITFIVSSKYQEDLSATRACAVIMSEQISISNAQSIASAGYAGVICEHPYLLYALVAAWFDKARQPVMAPGIHPSAVVAHDASVDPSAHIGPHVVVGNKTRIEANTQIHANCSIGAHCVVGKKTVLYPGVTLYDNVSIGDAGIVHSGAVLGADGFGFAPNPLAGPGAWGKIAQLGGVRIGNDVEIGANTTIDRGALEDTVIGNGVKLDNQIMIAHNCHVGDHTAMAACVGVAGSTQIGARCTIGGAAMLSGHLKIADDVHISGGTAITADISVPGRYTGVLPFATHSEWQRNAAVIGQLSHLRKRLRQLEKK